MFIITITMFIITNTMFIITITTKITQNNLEEISPNFKTQFGFVKDEKRRGRLWGKFHDGLLTLHLQHAGSWHHMSRGRYDVYGVLPGVRVGQVSELQGAGICEGLCETL